MPGLTARSAGKNISKSKRSANDKNAIRVDAAINDELEDCTYGKVIKACGNKMFIISDVDKREHLAHVRGKIVRVNLNDVVLLSIREYESRAGTEHAVFDIMAVFTPRDVSRLIKANKLPSWMNIRSSEEDDGDDIFDYGEGEGDGDDEAGKFNKRNKMSHRKSGVVVHAESDGETGAAADVEIDIDNI